VKDDDHDDKFNTSLPWGLVLPPPTPRYVLRHFCCNASRQFTPPINLRSPVFGLTPSGWFIRT